MAEYVTKKKIVKGEVVETTYRVDPDFVPAKIAEICVEFIENYCVAKSETAWLVATATKKSYITTKKVDGVKKEVEVACDNYPFVNLRKDFTTKFFPQILKGTKKKTEETFAERVMRLYGNK